MYFSRRRCSSAILILLCCAIYISDAYVTYHVSFLGRNASGTVPVGMLLQKSSTGTLPVITHNVSTCSLSTSDWGGISGFNSIEFNLPDCIQLVPNGIEVAKKGIRVESADEFTLHVIQADGTGSPGDGFLAIPDEHLGTRYYVLTYCSTGGTCQFAVTGIADNTTVEIKFPNNTLTDLVCVNGSPSTNTFTAGATVPFVIDELDVLHFESKQDLSGTYIYASKKVAVFVGSRDVPSASGTVSDMIEQIPPISKWGTEFVVAPNYLNDAGDIVKIITQTDNTVIHILGFSPFIIEKAGEAVEKRFDWQMHSTVQTSNPVLMIQVLNLGLYNTSYINNPTGSVAMVLVAHVDQWVDTELYFHCMSSAENNSLIAIVSDTGSSSSISLSPAPTLHFSPWADINGSNYKAMIAKPANTETSVTQVTGVLRSMYGFCDGKYAMLLGANWEWDNEGCLLTTSSPGDDRDNDCDGNWDEDTCTDADLEFRFTASQNSSGETNFMTINVRGAGHFDVEIKTCDIAVIKLRTNTDPEASITIKISQTVIVEQICLPECFPAYTEVNSVVDCTIVQKYTLEWSEDAAGLKHTFHTADYQYDWDIDNEFGIDYSELVLSALTGKAQFVVGLPVKDCAKMISETADTFGKKFVIPVSSADPDFSIILSTKNNLQSPITVELHVAHSLGPITMISNQSQTIEKVDITEVDYSRITLTVTDGEVSVYLLWFSLSTKATGLTILPADILGPSFLLYLDSSVNVNDPLAKVCDAFATDRSAFASGQLIPLNGHTEVKVESDIGTQYLFADRPVAVFCGTFTDTLVQMPPKETLGTVYYIPRLDLDSIYAVAELHVAISEDSVVLVVKGEYDQMDPVDFTGDFYTRVIETNTTYSVDASKPVQVLLQVRSLTGVWAAAVVIPPVEQYKSVHVFPGFDSTSFTFISSSAVSNNGTNVVSQVTTFTTDEANTFTYTEGPTFSLTVLEHSTGNKIFVSSDVLYEDNNEICRLTKGVPGDGIDNDCDGLIDEEHCSGSLEPGTIDYDLDGSLNEDCANNTSAPSSDIQSMSIPLTMVTCSTVNDVTSNDGTTAISIDNGDTTVVDPVVVPEVPVLNSTEATYDPIQASQQIIMQTTTLATGASSSAPVETCVTECLCPCGWVNPPQNYTAEELAQIVYEIQEKLKVSKAELSSTIRTKTSAQDDRPSATAVGYVGLASIIVLFCLMALLDITTLFRDLKIMMDNLKDAFEP